MPELVASLAPSERLAKVPVTVPFVVDSKAVSTEPFVARFVVLLIKFKVAPVTSALPSTVSGPLPVPKLPLVASSWRVEPAFSVKLPTII